ncbi:MAG: glutamate--tRNA ligase [Candidatus Nitrohelix vancouverensis]|uniref:Glutamate--tRNA ligase n=1 Tax=Candidatus Nitrohelix vancouverensis TaxID=2705534 RepID=A0A7T0C4M6_9BACT|nr:MAG: glutamate--tRNA ligase [Candidatus Nitrohelix vancouverensis]
MNTSVRVRFAPSPTGYLHIGGVRTALFNWLYARNSKGKFILRIEDTDVSRSTEESIQEIIESMQWLGLDWDEGPFRQMERREIYDQKITQLIDEGKAYRCYCPPEELDAKRKEAMAKKLKPKYDGTCRNRSDAPEQAPFVVRFKAPEQGDVFVKDLLRGTVTFDNEELDDVILQRSDGTPTYNFVVVVDDGDMGITHVIRGDDHLSNTPRQVLLYDALNIPRPIFAHISMILGPDKTRLSKRHGATSALAYRDMGYLPDALINYLARLGWSHGDQEIFTREEMVQWFSFDSVSVSAAVFNPEKLLWLNHQYIQTKTPLELAALLEPILIRENILQEGHGKSHEEIAAPLHLLKERSQTLVEMANKGEFFYRDALVYDEKAVAKLLTAEAKPLLEQLIQNISAMETLEEATLETSLKSIVEQAGLKLGKLAQPVRVALTGQTASPGIYDVILLLGKERTLERLQAALKLIP